MHLLWIKTATGQSSPARKYCPHALHCFVGGGCCCCLVNYYRKFLLDPSTVLAPIYQLLHKDSQFVEVAAGSGGSFSACSGTVALSTTAGALWPQKGRYPVMSHVHSWLEWCFWYTCSYLEQMHPCKQGISKEEIKQGINPSWSDLENNWNINFHPSIHFLYLHFLDLRAAGVCFQLIPAVVNEI